MFNALVPNDWSHTLQYSGEIALDSARLLGLNEKNRRYKPDDLRFLIYRSLCQGCRLGGG